MKINFRKGSWVILPVLIISIISTFISSPSVKADSFTTTGANDYYFTLEEAQTFTVRTFAQQYGIDSMLWLYDSNNQVLAANDDWFGLDSYITTDLSAGTYRLRTGVCCGDPNRWYGTSYVIDVNIAPTNAPTTTTSTTTSTTTIVTPETTVPETTVPVTNPTTTTIPETTTTSTSSTTTTTTTTIPEPTTTVPETTTTTIIINTTEPSTTTTVVINPPETLPEPPAEVFPQPSPDVIPDPEPVVDETPPDTTSSIPEETTTTTSEPEETAPTEPEVVTTTPEEVTTTTEPVDTISEEVTPEEVAVVLEEIVNASVEEVVAVLSALSTEEITAVIENISVEQLTEVLNDLPAEEVVNLIESVDSAEALENIVDAISEETIDPDTAIAVIENGNFEELPIETVSEIFAAIEPDQFTDEQKTELSAALTEAPAEVKEAFEEEIDIYGDGFDDYVPTGSSIDVGTRKTVLAAATAAASIAVGSASTGGGTGGSSGGSSGGSGGSSGGTEGRSRKEEESESGFSGEIAGPDRDDNKDFAKNIIYKYYTREGKEMKKFNWFGFSKKVWDITAGLVFTLAGSLVVYVTLSGETQRIAGIATLTALLVHYVHEILKNDK